MKNETPASRHDPRPVPPPASERETVAPPDLAERPTPAPAPAAMSAAAWSRELPSLLPARLGRYELRRLLGKGGMGAVYLAHDLTLDRAIALKIPSFGSEADPALTERFLREARAAGRLVHPNICPVHDAGQIDGVYYLAMAYVEGQSLAAILRKQPKLPLRQVAILVRQLALAMQEAHDHGIIHRDLKPANIVINQRKQPVVMDFGLARRAVDHDAQRITQSGFALGTPAYMPPEQANGDVSAMGPCSDIYSLGVVLYEMLCGRVPFEGMFAALLAQIIMDPPPPPSRFRPEIDASLEPICLRALAKSPADRYPSMREFAAALGAWLKEPAASAPGESPDRARSEVESACQMFAAVAAQPSVTARRPPAGVRAKPPTTPPSGVTRPAKKAARQRTNNVGVWATGAIAAAVVLMGVVLLLLRSAPITSAGSVQFVFKEPTKGLDIHMSPLLSVLIAGRCSLAETITPCGWSMSAATSRCSGFRSTCCRIV